MTQLLLPTPELHRRRILPTRSFLRFLTRTHFRRLSFRSITDSTTTVLQCSRRSLSLLQDTPIYKLATQSHQRVRFHQTRNPHNQQRIREVQFTPARMQDGFS